MAVMASPIVRSKPLIVLLNKAYANKPCRGRRPPADRPDPPNADAALPSPLNCNPKTLSRVPTRGADGPGPSHSDSSIVASLLFRDLPHRLTAGELQAIFRCSIVPPALRSQLRTHHAHAAPCACGLPYPRSGRFDELQRVREERNAPFWIHGVLPRPSLPCPSDNFDLPAARATVPRPPPRSAMVRRATQCGAERADQLNSPLVTGTNTFAWERSNWIGNR